MPSRHKIEWASALCPLVRCKQVTTG